MKSLSKELADIRDTFSCTIKEGETLYKLAMKSKEAIVEIGSWKGYSTIWLAKGSKAGNNVRIYAIDTFDGDIHNFVTGEGETYKTFVKNAIDKGVEDIIVAKVMKSEAAEKSINFSIGLLWIDGDHEDVEKDFARWYPHVVVGGTIALHDTVYGYDMKPYKVAVKELYKSGKFADVKRVGCITHGRKVSQLSVGKKIGNKLSLYSRYIYQFYISYYTKCLIFGAKCLGRQEC